MEKNPCKDVKRLRVTQTKDRLMVLVGLFTGLRLGGVLSLSWDDINFGNGIISSSHKTGRLVSIPMSEYLKNELQGYRKHSTDDMVFGPEG